MSEPVITCPDCHSEIKLTESLAAPLIEAARKDYEDHFAEKDVAVAKTVMSLPLRLHPACSPLRVRNASLNSATA